jgi:ABC-type glycerol-3-phosphate transport system substrate-binding protein
MAESLEFPGGGSEGANLAASSPSRWTRRRFLSGLASSVVAGAGLTAGCRPRQSPRALTVWLIWPLDPGMPATSLVERLRSAVPDVELGIGTVSTDNLREKLAGATTRGALPDIFLINTSWMRELGSAATLADLGALCAADTVSPGDLLVTHDHQRCQIDGRLLSLPAVSARATSMLFVNNELLGRFGLHHGGRFANWTEFTKASKAWVTRANGGSRLECIAIDPFLGPGMVVHTSLALGIGAANVSPDGRRSQLDSPGALRVARALDAYVEEVYGRFGGYRALQEFRFRFGGQHRQPTFYALPYERSFANITAAGTIGVYGIRGIEPQALSIQPVPGLDRLHGGILSHGWAYAINRLTPNLEDAWRVVRFLTLDEAGAGRFCLDYRRPCHLRAIGDAKYRAIVGEIWSGVQAAMELDIAYPASADDEFLRFHMFTVPMRRLLGEDIETIFRDLHRTYQAFLDARREPA